MVTAKFFKTVSTNVCLALLSLSAATASSDPVHNDSDSLNIDGAHNDTVQLIELNQLPLVDSVTALDAAPLEFNKNPLAHVNLFKRAGCTFTTSGTALTCRDSSNICCTNAQDGWCCPNTNGCGNGTPSTNQCTWRINWYTYTSYITSQSTYYSTYVSTVAGATSTSTVMSTAYVTVTADMETSTAWTTVTVTTSARAGKRGAPAQATPYKEVLPYAGHRSTPALSQPTPTTGASAGIKKVHQEVLKPAMTDKPDYIQVRGILIPRQTLRTDTSTTTSTSYVYQYVTVGTTIYSSTTSITYIYSTSTGTRTAAANAKKTITSTSTVFIIPGASAPIPGPTSGPDRSTDNNNITPIDTPSKGLSTGAQAGIGVGASLGGSLIIAIIVGFCWRRRSKKDPNTTAVAAPPMQQQQHQQHLQSDYKPPLHSPASPPGTMTPSNGYANASPPPPAHYGSPPAAPMYGFPHHSTELSATPMPMPMNASPAPSHNQPYPQRGSVGGASPPQGQYQYPVPHSPSLAQGSPRSEMVGSGLFNTPPVQQAQPQQGYPQGGVEMPTEMYSPHPQRPV